MKSATQFSAFVIGFSTLILSFQNAHAATYTTLNSGMWNDVTNVWSLDGITPCSCNPGTTTAGNDIVINHALTFTSNLVINAGSNFAINAGGTLSGPFNINMWNSTVMLMGDLSAARYTQDLIGTTTLTNGALMTLTNRFLVINGDFIVDNGLITVTGGNFEINIDGAFYAYNGSKVNILSGNIENEGYIFIDSDCCLTTQGTWRNRATGTVDGSGSAMSTIGNMSNAGVWDINIKWCSLGADFGMPSPEDCPGANVVCSAIVLPVELVNFHAKPDNNAVLLNWATLSERDNAYFTIQHAIEGNKWNDLGTLDGIGTSTEVNHYTFTHNNPTDGVNYYRLIQHDVDGKMNYSEVIAVEFKSLNANFVVYPNPVSAGTTLRLLNPKENDAVVEIYSTSGKLLTSNTLLGGSRELNITELSTGMYLLRLIDGDTVQSTVFQVN